MMKNPDDEIVGDPATIKFLCKFASMLNKRFGRPCRELIDCENLIESYYSSIANFFTVEEVEDDDEEIVFSCYG